MNAPSTNGPAPRVQINIKLCRENPHSLRHSRESQRALAQGIWAWLVPTLGHTLNFCLQWSCNHIYRILLFLGLFTNDLVWEVSLGSAWVMTICSLSNLLCSSVKYKSHNWKINVARPTRPKKISLIACLQWYPPSLWPILKTLPWIRQQRHYQLQLTPTRMAECNSE